MSWKTLLIIAIEEDYLNILFLQIKDIFREKIRIRCITIENLNHASFLEVDAILLSSTFIYQLVKAFLPITIPVIHSKRTINTFNTKELLDLPKGQTILVVNDRKENTDQTVESLNSIVFEHHFIPYYPDQQLIDEIEYIVTPGERHLVPSFFNKVIDIGIRVLDLETVYSIIKTLELPYNNQEEIVTHYMKSLVHLSNKELKSEEMINKEELSFKKKGDEDNDYLINVIEQHGFLEESLHILKIFLQGKENFSSYGRKSLEKLLVETSGIELTEQQLRQRLKILKQLGLVNVRQGRAGTTISQLGETFLKHNVLSCLE